MTKEKLEKEAEKYADGIYHYKINVSDYGENGKINYRYSYVKEAYLASAEPREKQIQIDAKQIRALQKQNGELTDKVKELEAQIEKMKCCAKCAHCNTYITSCIPQKRFVRLEDVCEDFELRR